MDTLTIRPTLKFIRAGGALAAIAVVALECLYWFAFRRSVGEWVALLPPLVLLWPLAYRARRQLSKVVISDDRLRYETGAASKSTRTLPLTKLQDVRVQQGVLQRMLDIGDLSLETVGADGHLTIPNVDSPQALADEILNRAKQR